ncbi:hypothetical protein [Pseudoalteromonas aurantia]|uniref:Uncharacterized protein n=1 Tax=Pseudoalteromonas aurantia 208 TaxID=1314867 RepID=A0ABR9EGN8_9GAMM|nr:hypothetical protein [Pseudoalteromonas aurantia]MBE0370161.1 hypothetical protein [Pseudoalteromonas aurantia 208]
MNIIAKTALFFTLLNISTFVQAKNDLTTLPFGIVIGKTTNEEIENRGTCIREIKLKDNHFRCEKYSMSNRFYVYSSQNEIVSKLYFFNGSSSLELSNSMPRKWKKLGLKFRDDEDNKHGTLKKDLVRIVKQQGAADVQVSRKDTEYDFREYVTWYIGDYFYEATLYRETENEDAPGLFKLTIVEAY